MDKWVNRCKECGQLVEVGHKHPECEKKRRVEWKAWVDAGSCPRCEGKRPLDPGSKSCFECGFGVGEGDGYVGAIFDQPPRHKRLAAKWKARR